MVTLVPTLRPSSKTERPCYSSILLRKAYLGKKKPPRARAESVSVRLRGALVGGGLLEVMHRILHQETRSSQLVRNGRRRGEVELPVFQYGEQGVARPIGVPEGAVVVPGRKQVFALRSKEFAHGAQKLRPLGKR